MADTTKKKMSGWMARLLNTAEEGDNPDAAQPPQEAAAAENGAEPAAQLPPDGPPPAPVQEEAANGQTRQDNDPLPAEDVLAEVPMPFPNLELPERGEGANLPPLPPLPETAMETVFLSEEPVGANGQEGVAAQEIDQENLSEIVPADLPPLPPESLSRAGEDAVVFEEQAPAGEAMDSSETLEEELEEDQREEVPPPPVAGPSACPACTADWSPGSNYCADCGFMLPAAPTASSQTQKSSAARIAAMPQPNVKLRNRFQVGELIQERQGICRYRGTDHGQTPPRPITIVWGPLSAGGGSDNPFDDVPVAVASEEDILPSFDDPVPVAAPVLVDAEGRPVAYPSVAWEKAILEKAKHPAVPAIIDHFVENNFEYLIVDNPPGHGLWEAWDEPEAAEARVRYGWLMQIAEGLDALHQAGAIVEGLRPELVKVSNGQAVISDLTDLLPFPVPPGAPIRGTHYTAPELMLSPGEADARSDLYSFGAMLYSLEYLHRPLEDKHFERQFAPKSIADEFPDVHPLILRIVNKTFTRDINIRFPTDEAQRTDATGFQELVKTLEVLRRNLDTGRLDIACWTTTGMIRTGNEDAFTVLHGVDQRLDDINEYAMVLLADGMGGYEAGELAANMALNELRTYLLGQPMFAALTGGTPPEGEVNVANYKQVLLAALKHANKAVYTAARTPGKGKRGMGCTAEAVYVDSRNVIVGHVGDSRTYHVTDGRLVQLTRDQTLVNRLVELGQLTEEEAEDHPRKNELQQAIGGQPDVSPGTYSGKLKRGDWILVCSDGVTNHINNKELEKMLTREAYDSAEIAARRLVNLVNLRGATDNSTVVVIRVC